MAKPQQIARSIRSRPPGTPLLSWHPRQNRHKTARHRCLVCYDTAHTPLTTPHSWTHTLGEWRLILVPIVENNLRMK